MKQKSLLGYFMHRRGIVSIGRAVEIAGVSYQEFLRELLKRGIDTYEYDGDGLAEELLEWGLFWIHPL
ncbi:hypothetical protein TQ32_08385 [Pyrococcus kukulkanii]|uniref:Uncharacterized protein n=1 Tax=Pyrococcus kukulkanii TaxID=1609559 RepID=A0A127BAY7_9EURY|nr:hypothetical protein TQ32_08385 [Pyrococcus kukulkanii]